MARYELDRNKINRYAPCMPVRDENRADFADHHLVGSIVTPFFSTLQRIELDMHSNLKLLTSLFVVALAALTLVACSGFGSFSFTEQSNVIIVKGNSLPLADLLPTTIPMEVDLEQELERQDASGARAVYLTELYLEMVDESEEPDFDFLDSLTLRVSSDSHGPDTIAWKDPVGTGQRRVELDVDDSIDIKPHAEEGLRFRTQASGSSPSKDAQFRVFATFRVDVL